MPRAIKKVKNIHEVMKFMKLDWQHTVTLIVAIITLLGTSTLVGNFLYLQLTKPIMVIDIVDNDIDNTKSKKVQIDVQNHGLNPATNLSLVIDPDGRIHSISNIISSTNVNLIQPNKQDQLLVPKQDPTILDSPFAVLKTPVFSGGDGSLLKLSVDANRPDGANYNLSNFNVYAVYDQGSTKGSQDPSHDVLIIGLQDIYNNYFSILLIIISGIVIVAAIWLIPKLIRWYKQRKHGNRIWFSNIKPNDNEGVPGDVCFNTGATSIIKENGWIKIVGTAGTPSTWKLFGNRP